MSLRHLQARMNRSPKQLHPLPTQADLHPYLSTDKIALHRLATFAHKLYERKHTGHYVCTLPIGYGKTTGFLVPFVIECTKRDSSKGITIACERMEQVKEYTDLVNESLKREVAFPLLGHHPDSCPLAQQDKPYNSKECSRYHAVYAKKAKDYPILFLTHAMLALKGAEPFQTWAGGKRVMVMIDEKPSAWWRPGNIDGKRLLSLQKYLTTLRQTKTLQAISSAIEEVKEALQALQLGEEFLLSTQLPPEQMGTLSFMVEENPKHKALRETLENLCSLGETTGRVISEGGKKCIILASRKPLPSMPTLILDATGELDPSYLSSGVERIPLDAWEGIPPPQKHIHLETWDCNLTKSIQEDDERWDRLVEDVARLLTETRTGTVYIIGAKDHKQRIKAKLKDKLSLTDFKRLRFNHYGNTKGSNKYRHAVAIVFTTTQFKPEWWYRATALMTGKGDVTSRMVVKDGNRRFECEELEDIRIRDTVTVLTQEIGRTQIRKDKPCTLRVMLPWCDSQGIVALRIQLWEQFQATIAQTPLAHKTKEENRLSKVVEIVTREGIVRRNKLAIQLGIEQPETLRTWIGKNKKELIAKGIQVYHHTLTV